MAFPGPDCLGRGLVLRPGQPVPEPFRGAPMVAVDSAALEAPDGTVAQLHAAWAERRRVVVVLLADPERLKAPQRCELPPYALPHDFAFARERLHFLTWANNYDATAGEPVWRLARHAVTRLGARPGTAADVQLPDGREAWCDGGPRGPLPVPTIHGETLALDRLRVAPANRSVDPDLAEDQRAAVLHPSGAARVIAPAGSGKTRVLAARLRYLLRDRGYDAEAVTAVAYNKRAAVELEERTADVRPRVKTLHALGYEILRRRGSPRLVQEREVRGLLRHLVRIEPQRGKDPWAAWIEALAEVRLALREPEAVERSRGDVPGFASAFPRYRRMLRDQDLIDHDEQIYGALEILLASPEDRRVAQRQCRHLLVDEFQDLTPAYLMLIRLLAAPAFQVYGVGDDDQVIYGYLGATPEYLIGFADLFPGAGLYALECNYRCPPPVVEAAAHLLRHNRRRVAKTIRAAAGREADAAALVVETVPSSALAERALAAIRGLLASGVAPEAIAVLCRVNEALLPVQVALGVAGIECSTPVDRSVMEHTGIRTALAWLGLGCGPDKMATDLLRETIHRPSRKIRRDTSDRLAKRAVWSFAELQGFARALPHWEADEVRGWLEAIRRLRGQAARETTAGLLRHIRKGIGLGAEMESLDASHSDAAGGSHLDELVALEQLAPLHPDAATFEAWLRERLERRSSTGVVLSSVHRVKGLEWDHVIVYGASDGLMPHRLAVGQKEEERRVFHVALTRARRSARILANAVIPSPFIAELTEEAAPAKRRSHFR